MEKLNKEDISEVLSQTLPKQNNFYETDYSDELQELLLFGINTKESLFDLVTKHRVAVLEIDASEMDEFHIDNYISEFGKEYMDERIKNKFWFAYPALLRIILELEYGEKYKEFADKRDNI